MCCSIIEYIVLEYLVLEYMHRACLCSVMTFTALKYIVYVLHYMIMENTYFKYTIHALSPLYYYRTH